MPGMTNKREAFWRRNLDKALAKANWKLSPEERAEFSKTMETRVKALSALFPKSEGWATDTIVPVGVKLKENKTKGRQPDVQFATGFYTFDRDAKGDYLTRYLKTKKGEPLIENPDWKKRVEELAMVGAEKMMDLINRGDERSDTILAQIGWYKPSWSIISVIPTAGCPICLPIFLAPSVRMTGMKENWKYGIQALGKVDEG